MILKELYENVTQVEACGQDKFLSHVDTTVRALIARYGERYVLLPGNQAWIRVREIESEIPVYEAYFPAIRDNVLFMLTGNGDRKTDYVAEAEDAYKSVWRRKMRGKRFRDADYDAYSLEW